MKEKIVENFIRAIKYAYLPQNPVSLALSIEYAREAALAVLYYSQLKLSIDSDFFKHFLSEQDSNYIPSIHLFTIYYWNGNASNRLLLGELRARYELIPQIRASLNQQQEKISKAERMLNGLAKLAGEIPDATHRLATEALITDLQELTDIYFTLAPTFDFLPETLDINSAERERLKKGQYDCVLEVLEERITEYQNRYPLDDSENNIYISCLQQFYLLLAKWLQTFRDWIRCDRSPIYSSFSYYFQPQTLLEQFYKQTDKLINVFKI